MLFIEMIEAQPLLDRTIEGELFDPVLRARRESPRRENALELLIHANNCPPELHPDSALSVRLQRLANYDQEFIRHVSKRSENE